MPTCSDPTYDPGPVAALDLGGFDGTLEPPTMAPLAQAFADQTSPFLTTLDVAYGALEAESVLDVGGDVVDAIAKIPTSGQGAVNAEATDALTLAQSGFENARASVVELKSWLPPDVLTPTYVSPIVFVVHDVAGAPIPGALVTVDQDTGRGTQFLTGSVGEALVEIALLSTVGWTVSADGHTSVSGVTTGQQNFSTVRVTLP
ncbi:MAG TPA: hypothetical protein VJN96_08735 [Vicinamibacterales bacterium]|nr:hypothetical protein [Vicinamibacterales bacterium]